MSDVIVRIFDTDLQDLYEPSFNIEIDTEKLTGFKLYREDEIDGFIFVGDKTILDNEQNPIVAFDQYVDYWLFDK